MGALRKGGIIRSTRVHTSSVQQNAALPRNHSREHAFDVVITIRRLLTGFCCGHCVRHQEYRDLMFRFLFLERMGKAQRVVDTL